MKDDAAIPVELLLARLAKPMCSAIWVSGRDPQEAADHSVFADLPDVIRDLVTLTIDEANRAVNYTMQLDAACIARLIEAYRHMHPDFETDWDREAKRLLAQGSVTRTAMYVGDQGCVILPMDGSGLKFQPVDVQTVLPQAATMDWPMGDRVSDAAASIDLQRVQAGVQAAFANPTAAPEPFSFCIADRSWGSAMHRALI